MKLPKKKRPSTKQKLAKRFWDNEKPEAPQLSKKYSVSISTAYRWISEWEQEGK